MSFDLRRDAEPVPGYRLIEWLGRGGFGEVWKAEGPGSFKVALKFVPLAEQAGPVELRALQIIREIRHPHLLATFGSWQCDDTLIIAMELAERTLLDRFREAVGQGFAGIPVPEIFEHFLDAAKGIDYLNEPRHPSGGGEPQRIQHRDIKPANLLLVGGSVKVADFGVARILEHSQTGHTGSLTPSYAAPEFFDRRTSSQSDQYSLAVTYCHLRGGRLPFTGTQMKLMFGHLMLSPDMTMLPEAERPIVGRALAKAPGDRWPSCRAFVQAVSSAGAAGDRATPIALPPSATGSLSTPIPDTRRPELTPGLDFQDLVSRVPAEPEVAGPGPPPAEHAVEDDREAVGTDSQEGMPPIAGQTSGEPSIARSGAEQRARPRRKISVYVLGVLSPIIIGLLLWASGEFTLRTPEDPIGPNAPEITNSLGMKLTLIPAGEFLMGSTDSDKEANDDEKPPHRVRITRPFYLGMYEVTQQEYETVMGGNPSWFSAQGGGMDRVAGQDTRRHPVESVSWNDAITFCNKLSEREGLRPYYRFGAGAQSGGDRYRMPTEAEWEYACRAGSTTRYSFGDDAGRVAGVRRRTPVPWSRTVNRGPKTDPSHPAARPDDPRLDPIGRRRLLQAAPD
ncbi:MAG: SUMF1/EgtB/PvdO family nonheme iron enzyme, partial [Planctomycetaceae bacterium]|nr:SUMF1/EgtB/PvdO family nonheme iron enzyme [Planctomycetaceae bacterium]